MEEESKRQQQRVEVGLKVNLKYPDREAFVERFSINVSRSGLFVRAKDPLPVGSRVRFEYRLGDNTRILRGVGLVRWSRDVDTADLDNPPGMGIEFVDLDPQSEELVSHIVATHGDGTRAPKRAPSRPRSSPRPVAVAKRSTLPNIGATDGEDTALDAIDALGGLGAGNGAQATASDESLVTGENEAIPSPPAPFRSSGESFEEDSATHPDAELDSEDLSGDAIDEDLLEGLSPPEPLHEVQSAGAAPLVSDPLEPVDLGDESAAVSSRVDLAADRLVMDLGGTDLLTALVTRDNETVDRFNEHNVAVRVGADGSLQSEGGLWLPSVLAWFEPDGAAPRAKSMADRLGWELVNDGSGLSVVIDGFPVLVNDVLFETLKEATRPHREQSSQIAETVLVLPAATHSATRRLLTTMLRELGVENPKLLSGAEAVLASVGLNLEFGQQALVVQVTLFETRVTLVEGPDRVRGFRSALDAGLWAGDQCLSSQAGVAMLREHGIDADDDPSLLESLHEQVQRLRRQHVGDGPWSFSLAGAEIEATPADVSEWCSGLSERIALMTHGVMTENEVDGGELEALILITDEMPWPGLIEKFEELLDVSPILPDAGPWIRIDGASR